MSKSNNKLLYNAEDLNIAMLIYICYSDNYSMTSGCLQNYYRDRFDEVDDDALNSKSFIIIIV